MSGEGPVVTPSVVAPVLVPLVLVSASVMPCESPEVGVSVFDTPVVGGPFVLTSVVAAVLVLAPPVDAAESVAVPPSPQAHRPVPRAIHMGTRAPHPDPIPRFIAPADHSVARGGSVLGHVPTREYGVDIDRGLLRA
jgi:hypothetical protein